jgi:hypothetical protein
MAEGIRKQITENIIQKEQFALQLDETKDISSCAQLMVFVSYTDDEYEKGSTDYLVGRQNGLIARLKL